ncbi:methionyl-tRNA formyltransferase [bacterium]|nr:methionyl-tRNA formyltransferase [bacterium]
MRIVFMGTPEFAVPTLRALHREHSVLAAVSLADKPRGRGHKVSPSPVKACALELGLPVYQPARVRDEEFLREMSRLAPDAIVVAAYSRLIPSALLQLPRWGCLNLHPSFLPRYRGAVPVPAAIMHGDEKTAVTVFRMDEGYDTGDLLLWREETIGPSETGTQLLQRLAEAGAETVLDALRGLEDGALKPIPQDNIEPGFQRGEILYTKPFTKESLSIDWNWEADCISNFVRALMDVPTASTLWRGEVLKIGEAQPYSGEVGGCLQAAPGQIVAIAKGRGPVVAAGQGYVLLAKVKPAGKGWMDGWSFAQGRQVSIGDRLG